MAELEPCTTWSMKRAHQSTDLAPTQDLSVGRVGRTLCGEEAHDEQRMNKILDLYGIAKQVSVATLPPCKRCNAKATKLTQES